ncbi:PAMP-induced secreted peptide [Trifolium repens]|nr:PAMP-induced secreted peptide [Trifolium repens]
MDTRLTFLTLILLVSLFVSEARPLVSPLLENEGVIGVFRTLKDSGPSPGVGHKLKKLQILEGMKNSGPSSGGVGHKYNTHQVLGVIKNSGPTEGHK